MGYSLLHSWQKEIPIDAQCVECKYGFVFVYCILMCMTYLSVLLTSAIIMSSIAKNDKTVQRTLTENVDREHDNNRLLLPLNAE